MSPTNAHLGVNNDLQLMSKSAISMERSFFSNPTHNATATDFMSPTSEAKIETKSALQFETKNLLRGQKPDLLQSAIYNRNNYTLNSNYNREHQAKRSEDGLSIFKPKNSYGIKSRELNNNISYMPHKRPNTQSVAVHRRVNSQAIS